MELRITSPTTLMADGATYECRIGRAGISANKREGDLMTPAGQFPLRLCYYRPDRVMPPLSGLTLVPLTPQDGWCDDPADMRYNQAVTLPYPARHELLWREDHLYDLIIPMGYNDGPIIPGRGSAIFLHCMREDGVGTEGCVALKKADLLAILPKLGPESRVIVGE